MRGPLLQIDLSAIAANYQYLSNKIGPTSVCAAVVKANAYGLGMEKVANTLFNSGCRDFFVAYYDEAETLYDYMSAYDTKREAKIYILHGLYKANSERLIEKGFIPILNTHDEIEFWQGVVSNKLNGNKPASAVHFDTGLNRLGLEEKYWDKYLTPTWLSEINCQMIMSHLACADEPDHEMNAIQLERFHKIRNLIPKIKGCLANSSGIFLGEDYHYDMVRPGAALYGLTPQINGENPLRSVVSLFGNILQIKTISKGDIVGYGAHYKADKAMKIAVVSIGYADGFFRSLGNKCEVRYKGQRLPIIGRISMDLMVIDISTVRDEHIDKNMKIELINSENTVDNVGQKAGTIGYEVLTNFAHCTQKDYIEVGKTI